MTQISLAEYREEIEASIARDRYEEAVAHGRHILGQYPKYVRAYWLLGKAMLEAGRAEHASDMFQRVLSADPEHLLAWVGMSEIAEQRGNLEAAVWYLERAFELATDNEMVAEQLRHLYGELAGREPERLQLTQGALARLYLREISFREPSANCANYSMNTRIEWICGWLWQKPSGVADKDFKPLRSAKKFWKDNLTI